MFLEIFQGAHNKIRDIDENGNYTNSITVDLDGESYEVSIEAGEFNPAAIGKNSITIVMDDENAPLGDNSDSVNVQCTGGVTFYVATVGRDSITSYRLLLAIIDFIINKMKGLSIPDIDVFHYVGMVTDNNKIETSEEVLTGAVAYSYRRNFNDGVDAVNDVEGFNTDITTAEGLEIKTEVDKS